jgi:cell surface protein SprA
LLSGTFGKSSILAQESPDSLQTEEQADSMLSGVKYFFITPNGKISSLPSTRRGALYGINLSNDNTSVTWDTVSTYRIQRSINGRQLYLPQVASFNEFRELKKEQQKKAIRASQVRESIAQEDEGRGLLDFKISVPGGENSAFTTIFGTNEVNLRVNGSANMNVGASIQKLDDGTLPPDLRTRVDPTFNQNLQLNIQGTIGDKLTIATDWDTERQFDFENRLSIVYRGYEDEIIKSIEMGNVSMETGNSLVSGGKSLFGIKAVTELGPLRVTSVVSQQKGKNNTQKISGGSQEQDIQLNPADYEDGRHFFLDFYNRASFEQALSDPQNIQQPYDVTELYVYIRKTGQSASALGEQTVQAIALLDLGVNTNGGLPGNEVDRFTDEQLDSLRSTDSNATNEDFGATSQEYTDDVFELLQEGVDYTFNRALGFLSMKTNINNGDAIAVAYVYNTGSGQTIQVGELTSTDGNRQYLKLLRPGGMTTQDRAWPLTMRNIYFLGVQGITPDGFELDIYDTRDNIPQVNLPGRPNATLLQDLGLDRQDSEGATSPDNIIDMTGITLDAGSGRLMFPYLEPFGDRILDLIGNAPEDSAYAFTELYDIKQQDARDNSKNTTYSIEGVSSGGVSGTYILGFGLIEGSVKAFANNVELIEGTDYEVDYSFGSLTILNDKYLASGQEIEVEFESNQFSIIGQKNFTGVRAEYTVNQDIQVGGTYFKLKEQPLSDKIRIGNEPINNTVLGFDGNASFDAPWLTRFIDKIPLLQTKTPSSFSFQGEFAQLRPGVAQTNAVQEAIDNGELYPDEENGLVFIDDFEGAEYTISMTNPTRWNLASAPAAIPGYDPDESYFLDPGFTPPSSIEDRKARSDLRSQFSWYSIPRNLESVKNAVPTFESAPVEVQDVFQGREITNFDDQLLTPLDVHFNPANRGPYNYNRDLKNVLENNPESTWGGMTYVIPSGQEDLVQNNIEFLEFWVQAVVPGGDNFSAPMEDYDGKIYIDLGIISEDIIPNVRLNTEDGLSTVLNNLTPDDPDGDPRSYIPPSPPVPLGQFSNSNREREDVGLDGAPNPGTPGAEGRDEESLFGDFIQSIRDSYGEGSDMLAAVEADPSNDDYVYYQQDEVADKPLHERFFRVMGYHDGNTPENTNGNNNKRAITLKPDTEGLVSSASIQQANSYYQYEIDFNPADPNQMQIGAEGSYIVDKVTPSGSSTKDYQSWYLVRIPLSEIERKIGDIESFQNISYLRMWMSGYKRPMTLRFATLEFVGSQWKKVPEISEAPLSQDNFKVSTINIEENANREPFPYRQPDGSIRALNRGAQVQALENEQSLVLNVENLGPGEIQMVKRVYPGKLNLLNYSNIRMFIHGEGYQNKGDAELVIRIGNDLENNFYEYRQPVTPSEPRSFNYDPNERGRLSEEAQEIWRYDENSMNIIISAFNVLKQRRDDAQADPGELFEVEGLLEEDAVEGAVVAIKGNPSLDRVSEIGLGIKNPYDPMDPQSNGVASLDAEFWLNELRVSGFDNEFGWAANAKSAIKFADFATVNANLTRRTNGFGGLDSRLGTRSVSDQIGYGVSSTINMHKLVPDRFGWTFPVNITARRNTQTPKYLPGQGDIRLTDFKDAINSDEDLSSDEKKEIIESKVNDIETVSETFSFNMSNISKTGSRGKLAQMTLDNLRLSYNYNQGYSRNPQLIFENKWDYKTSLQYSLRAKKIRLFRPFAFTEDVPVVKALSGLRLGYLPSSISTSSTVSRRYNESRRRNLADPTTTQGLNQQHAFTLQNNFTLNYSLTQSIPISFSTSTGFDLSSAGIASRNQTGVDSSAFDVRPTFDVFKGVLTDSLQARRSTYQERYTASWRPTLSRIKSLSWLTYTLSYGGGYQWNNSARGSNLGAAVSNSFQLDNQVRINTDKIFSSLGFYSNMETANTEETNQRRSARNKRKQEIENDVPDSLRTPRPAPDLFKDLRYIGRKIFLSTFSMKEISGGYKRTKSGSQPGYNGASQIYYAFNSQDSDNFSPPMGYRLGFFDRIPQSQLVGNNQGNSEIRLPANNRYTDAINAGTRITPFDNLTIDLDWSANITSSVTQNITVSPNGQYSSTKTESGTYNTSVWAFGDGYESFFRKQLQTAFDDVVSGSTTLRDSLGNSDGRTVLNRNTMQEDFRHAYLGESVNGIGGKGFMVFPRPDWSVDLSSIQRFIPFLGKFMASASLRHAYTGSYRLDWSLNSVTGPQKSQALGNFDLIDVRGLYEPNTVRVERRFSPMAQLNVNWKSGLRTQFGYDRSTISSFAINSKRVTETLSRGVDFTVNYTFRNVSIPLFPKIKNNIDVSIRGNMKNDTENSYKLDTDLINALNASNITPASDPSQAEIVSLRETGQRRLNGTITFGYQVSRTISSNFEYTYSKIESNNIPTRTNHDIRFNVRIAIKSR